METKFYKYRDELYLLPDKQKAASENGGEAWRSNGRSHNDSWHIVLTVFIMRIECSEAQGQVLHWYRYLQRGVERLMTIRAASLYMTLILRKIRSYNRAGDSENELKWWARLTPGKRKDVKHILKNAALAQGFDDLLGFPGLWERLELGMLRRFLNLRCDEELMHYLKHIGTIWRSIFGEHPGSILDGLIVDKLELLAPASASHDMSMVRDLMSKGLLFPAASLGTRNALLENISRVSGLIPSLRTFFENLKYLEPCSLILKQLLPRKIRGTVRQAYERAYVRADPLVIQCSDGDFKRVDPLGAQDNIALGYQQLWLFAMRHFPELTELAPRKEIEKQKPLKKAINSARMHELGFLAVKLGFCTRRAIEDCPSSRGHSGTSYICNAENALRRTCIYPEG
ncbi:MAG: hypothetical protein M1828_002992 [Chrysothrix sp. TS-e1954]|nr:MAG: hypothetical protein M1828_002992 [Chrysothrix sp. TS-e1954]